MIYLDNSATTLKKPKEVSEAVYNAIRSEKFSNPSRGLNEMAINSLDVLIKTRMEIAKLFNIDNPLNVVMSFNATIALNMAIKSLAKKGHIISTMQEHNSVLRPLNSLCDCEISYLPLNENAEVDLENLNSYLREDTYLMIVNQCSNVSGKIIDLERIRKFCEKNKLFLIIDGAQGAGTLKLDLSKFKNTIYVFTGHKSLYGPQGTGGMIVKSDIELNEVFSGGTGFDSFNIHQPKILPDLFEMGTLNVHGVAGLLEGVKYVNKMGIDNIEEDLYDKTKYFYNELKKNKDIILYGDIGDRHGPIVSLNYKDLKSEELSKILWDEYSIATRAKSHCAPLFHKAMNTEERGMVRFSLSTFTRKEELDYVVKVLEKIKR